MAQKQITAFTMVLKVGLPLNIIDELNANLSVTANGKISCDSKNSMDRHQGTDLCDG